MRNFFNNNSNNNKQQQQPNNTNNYYQVFKTRLINQSWLNNTEKLNQIKTSFNTNIKNQLSPHTLWQNFKTRSSNILPTRNNLPTNMLTNIDPRPQLAKTTTAITNTLNPAAKLRSLRRTALLFLFVGAFAYGFGSNMPKVIADFGKEYSTSRKQNEKTNS
jgi:hypothetical protein